MVKGVSCALTAPKLMDIVALRGEEDINGSVGLFRMTEPYNEILFPIVLSLKKSNLSATPVYFSNLVLFSVTRGGNHLTSKTGTNCNTLA